MAEKVVFLMILIAGAFPLWIGVFFAYGLAQTLSRREQRREFFSQPWAASVVIGFTAAFLLAGGFLVLSAFTYEPAA